MEVTIVTTAYNTLYMQYHRVTFFKHTIFHCHVFQVFQVRISGISVDPNLSPEATNPFQPLEILSTSMLCVGVA